MQLYQCKVRLNSNIMHEVMKVVTVPEIVVLRAVHSTGDSPGGHAPVEDIKPIKGKHLMVKGDDGKERPITDAQERERLTRIYGPALRRSKDQGSVNAIFGVGTKLPQETEGMGVVIPDEPIQRTVVPPPESAAMLA
jgi:hypothetical protein